MQDIIYSDLEQQWIPLLTKFSNTKIRGMEQEDLLQEMRMCLWNAQNTFDPSKKVTFITYLYRTCQNRINNLIAYACRQKRNFNVIAIDDVEINGECDESLNTIECVSCLDGPSKTVAQAIILGYTKREILRYTGLSITELDEVIGNIKYIIGGYYG